MSEVRRINATISMFFNSDGLHLELHDELSRQTFVDLQLTPEQTAKAMSRLPHTPVEKCEVIGLDRVGLKMEHQPLQFPMPKHEWKMRSEVAYAEALKHCPEGWTASAYFGSQDSFFRKDGKEYAQTTIRRWVPVEEAE